jgi:hypothetical protein
VRSNGSFWSATILAAVLSVVARGAYALAQPPETTSVAEHCPGYASHVKAARSYLARGERTHALKEFLQARKALELCIEKDEEAENQTASVFGLTGYPDSD